MDPNRWHQVLGRGAPQMNICRNQAGICTIPVIPFHWVQMYWCHDDSGVEKTNAYSSESNAPWDRSTIHNARWCLKIGGLQNKCLSINVYMCCVYIYMYLYRCLFCSKTNHRRSLSTNSTWFLFGFPYIHDLFLVGYTPLNSLSHDLSKQKCPQCIQILVQITCSFSGTSWTSASWSLPKCCDIPRFFHVGDTPNPRTQSFRIPRCSERTTIHSSFHRLATQCVANV